jgi:hypothetical protein
VTFKPNWPTNMLASIAMLPLALRTRVPAQLNGSPLAVWDRHPLAPKCAPSPPSQLERTRFGFEAAGWQRSQKTRLR